MYPSQLELLNHIYDECKYLIDELQSVKEDEFYNSQRIKKAFVRAIEIIGEAANKLDNDFILSHPQVEWRLITGMRNRLIHEYFGVNYDIVWEVATNYIAPLKEWVEVFIIEERERLNSSS